MSPNWCPFGSFDFWVDFGLSPCPSQEREDGVPSPASAPAVEKHLFKAERAGECLQPRRDAVCVINKRTQLDHLYTPAVYLHPLFTLRASPVTALHR